MATEDQNQSQELSNERFGFTVFLSVCAHAILILGVGFTYLEELSSQPAMEITLAQYRSELAPDEADFLAQENQLGSGVLDEAVAPSTPFESDFSADSIEEVLPIPQAPRVVNEVELQNTEVLSTFTDGDDISQQLEEVESEQEQPLTEESSSQDLSMAKIGRASCRERV